MKLKAIGILVCVLFFSSCTNPSQNIVSEKDVIQYIILNQEKFEDQITDNGYEISIGVDEKYQERYDNGEVLVLSNDLDEEFQFYFGFDGVTKYNVFSKNEPQQPMTINLYKWDADASPETAAAQHTFDVTVGLSLEVGGMSNEYHSSSFEEYATRFRDEYIADAKIKAVMSKEELKALYDKGIDLQDWLFELYAQSVSE